MTRILDAREVRGAVWWQPHSPGARPREEPIRAILLHHTGGEGDGRIISRVLRKRRLSVHYTVAPDGTIMRHADPDQTVTFHAGEANGWTVGIEIANRGLAPPLSREPRVAYTDTVHGREIELLRFHPWQVGAVLDLCEILTQSYAIPWRWPMDGERVRRQVMPHEHLADWRGLLGHMHVSESKVDPSPHIMDDLAARATVSGMGTR